MLDRLNLLWPKAACMWDKATCQSLRTQMTWRQRIWCRLVSEESFRSHYWATKDTKRNVVLFRLWRVTVCFLSLQSLPAITALSFSHNTELCTQTPPVYYECVRACAHACVHARVCVYDSCFGVILHSNKNKIAFFAECLNSVSGLLSSLSVSLFISPLSHCWYWCRWCWGQY